MAGTPSEQALDFLLNFKTDTSALTKAKEGLKGVYDSARMAKKGVPSAMRDVNSSMKKVGDHLKLGSDRLKGLDDGWKKFQKRSKDTVKDLEKGIKRLRIENKAAKSGMGGKGLTQSMNYEAGMYAMQAGQQLAPQAMSMVSEKASAAASSFNQQIMEQSSLLNRSIGIMGKASTAARLMGKSLPFDPMLGYTGLLKGAYARLTGQAIKDTDSLAYKLTHLGSTLRDIVARSIQKVADNWENWISRIVAGAAILMAAKVEDRVTDMMRHVTMGTRETYQYMDTLGIIAGKTFASFDEVTEVMTDAVNWGYRARKNLDQFVTTTLKLSKATGVAVGEMSEFVYKLEDLYSVDPSRVVDIAAAMKYVADNTAASMDRLISHVKEAEEAILIMPKNVREKTIPMMTAWAGTLESQWINPEPIMRAFGAMTDVTNQEGMRLLNIVATTLGKSGPQLMGDIMHGGEGVVDDVFTGIIDTIRKAPQGLVNEYRKVFSEVLGMPAEMVLKIREMTDADMEANRKLQEEMKKTALRRKELMDTWEAMNKTLIDMFSNFGRVMKAVLVTLGAPLLIVLKAAIWPFIRALRAMGQGFLNLKPWIKTTISVILVLMTVFAGLIMYHIKLKAVQWMTLHVGRLLTDMFKYMSLGLQKLTALFIGNARAQALFNTINARAIVLYNMTIGRLWAWVKAQAAATAASMKGTAAEVMFLKWRARGIALYNASIGRAVIMIKAKFAEAKAVAAGAAAEKAATGTIKTGLLWRMASKVVTVARTVAQWAYNWSLAAGRKYVMMFAAGESMATIASAGLLSVMVSMVAVTLAWMSPLLIVTGLLVGLWAIFKHGARILERVSQFFSTLGMKMDMLIDYFLNLPKRVAAFFDGLYARISGFIEGLPALISGGDADKIGTMFYAAIRNAFQTLFVKLPKLIYTAIVSIFKTLYQAIIGFPVLIYRSFLVLRKTLPDIWKAVKTRAVEAWKSLVANTIKLWEKLKVEVPRIFWNALAAVNRNFEKVMGFIKKNWMTMIKMLGAALLIYLTPIGWLSGGAIAAAFIFYWDEIKKYSIIAWNWVVNKLPDIAKKGLEKAKKIFTSVWTYVSKSLPALLRDKWENFASGNFVNTVRSMASIYWAQITEAAKKVWEYLKQSWTRIKTNVINIWSYVSAYIPKKIKEIMPKVKSYITKAWDYVSVYIPNKIKAMIPKIKQYLVSLWARAKMIAITTWDKIRGYALQIWTYISVDLYKKAKSMWATALVLGKKYFADLKKFSAKAWDSIKIYAVKAFEFVKANWIRILQIMAAAMLIYLSPIGWITGGVIAAAIIYYWDTIKKYAIKTWKFISNDMVNYIKNALDVAVPRTKEFALKVWATIVSYWNKAIDYIINTYNTVWPKIVQASKKAWNFVSKYALIAWQWLVNNIGPIVMVTIPTYFIKAWEFIKKYSLKAWSWVTANIGPIITETIPKYFKMAWKGVTDSANKFFKSEFAAKAGPILKKVFGFAVLAAGLYAFGPAVWTAILKPFAGWLITSIGGFLATAITGPWLAVIGGAFVALIAASFIGGAEEGSGKLSAILNRFPLWGKVKTFLYENVYGAVKDAFLAVAKTIGQILKPLLKALWSIPVLGPLIIDILAILYAIYSLAKSLGVLNMIGAALWWIGAALNIALKAALVALIPVFLLLKGLAIVVGTIVDLIGGWKVAIIPLLPIMAALAAYALYSVAYKKTELMLAAFLKTMMAEEVALEAAKLTMEKNGVLWSLKYIAIEKAKAAWALISVGLSKAKAIWEEIALAAQGKGLIIEKGKAAWAAITAAWMWATSAATWSAAAAAWSVLWPILLVGVAIAAVVAIFYGLWKLIDWIVGLFGGWKKVAIALGIVLAIAFWPITLAIVGVILLYKLFKWIWNLIGGFKGVLIGIGIAMAIAFWPITLAVLAIYGLYKAFMWLWDLISPFGQMIWDTLTWPFSMLWDIITWPFVAAWDFLFGNTIWDFKGWIKGWLDLFKYAADIIIGIFERVWDIFFRPIKAVKEAIVEIANAIGDQFVKVGKAIESIFLTVWNKIKEPLSTILGMVEKIVNSVIGAAGKVMNWLFGGGDETSAENMAAAFEPTNNILTEILACNQRIEALAMGPGIAVRAAHVQMPAKPGEGVIPGVETAPAEESETVKVLKQILAVLKGQEDGGARKTGSITREALLSMASPLPGGRTMMKKLTDVLFSYEG